MRYQVTVLLEGGSNTFFFFASKKDAGVFIKSWAEAANESMETGNPRPISKVVGVQDADGDMAHAAALNKIVAMFILDRSQPTPQEKSADAVDRLSRAAERETRRGEEWRDEE